MKVEQEDGDWMRVSPTDNGCVESLTQLGNHEIPLWVRRSALRQVITRRTTIAYDGGATVTVSPGVPVEPNGDRKTLILDGLTVTTTIPGDTLADRYWHDEPIPPARASLISGWLRMSHSPVVHGNGFTLRFSDAEIYDAVPTESDARLVTLDAPRNTRPCLRLRFPVARAAIVANSPASHDVLEDRNGCPNWGLGPRMRPHDYLIAAGTPVSTLDGPPVGRVSRDTIEYAVAIGNFVCYQLRLAGGVLADSIHLCVPAASARRKVWRPAP